MVDLHFLHDAVDVGDFTDDVCRGLLDVLAEVEQLQAEVERMRASLAESHQFYSEARAALMAENEQLRAQRLRRQGTLSSALAALEEARAARGALFERVKILEKALPDARLLERVAILLEMEGECSESHQLTEAAARIRAVQEAKP